MKNLAVLHGKHVWVWYVTSSGGPQGVIEHARRVGARGVLVKCADGTTPWEQFEASLPALKEAGLVVGAWAYVYPQNVAAQAQVILRASRGADYLVVDAESEFEVPGTDAAAAQMGLRLRALAPARPVGLTTFALPDDHGTFPYLSFSRWVDFLAPQVYWADAEVNPDWMITESLRGLERYHLPIFPVGQGYSPATPDEIAAFSTRCDQLGIEGVSWWSLQSLTPANAEAIAQTDSSAPGARPTGTEEQPRGLDAKQVDTVEEIEKLAGELKSE